MKNIILLFILLLSCGFGFSQNKGSINFSYGRATDFKWPDSRGELQKNLRSSSAKLCCSYPVNKSLSVEAGLEYTRISLSTNTESDFSKPYTNRSTNLLSIPVDTKLKFLRYFFMNTGLSIDFNLNKNQNYSFCKPIGLGMRAGLGAELKLRNVCFTINPLFRTISTLPFQNQEGSQHLLELGIEYGVGYSF